jgi:hypothetical protein
VYTIRAELRDNPQAVCLDDRFEPNDLPSTATVATSILGTLQPDLTLCAGDEDWYLVELGPGEGLTAEIGFQSPADLELRLYEAGITDPNLTPLRASTGISVREHLAYRSFRRGEYVVRVHGHDGSEISPYELLLERVPPLVTCEPDVADQMLRGNSMMDPYELAPAPSRTDDLTFCSGDEDWYLITMQAGFVNVVRLQYIEADATLDLGLYNLAGQQIAQTAGTGIDSKEVAVSVIGAGLAPALLNVTHSSGFASAYSITIDLVPMFNCFSDDEEPNDTSARVSMVASSSTALPIEVRNLTLCASDVDPFNGVGDEDWFQVTPPAVGARLEASIEFQQGDLFLELYGPTRTTRACFNAGPNRCYSDGYDLTETVTFTSTLAAPLFLRVGSIYSNPGLPRPPDADTPYVLRVDFVGP